MSTEQQCNPAILITGFDGSEACLSLASELLQKGYPVIAACALGNQGAAEAARALGCAVVGSERGEAQQGGVESLLAGQYETWYEGNLLRAGLLFFHREMGGLPGAVCAGANAGYTAEDVAAVSGALLENPGRFVIAERKIGLKSGLFLKLERLLARMAFVFVHGRNIGDPWAGLRAIPSSHIPAFLEMKGTGRKYEFNMPLNLQRRGLKAVGVPVSAAYSREPGATFWSRIADLFRIVLVPLLFVASSLTLTGADYCMRFLFYYVILRGNEPASLAVGFYTGAFVGYLINRSVVFRKRKGSVTGEFGTIVKYAILTTCNYYLAHLLISFMMNSFHAAFPLASIIASVILYAPNFFAQREFVFRSDRRQPA